MRINDIIRRSGRSLKQAKARTLLTSLAIGVGAFTITLSLAAGAGGRSYTTKIVNANTNQREIVVARAAENSQEGPKEYSANANISSGSPFGESVPLNDEDIEKIKQVEGVESVSPSYMPNINYVTRPNQKQYEAQLSTFSPSVDLKYAAGAVEGELAVDEIVITEEYVGALGFEDNQDAIGKTISVVADKLSAPVSAPEAKSFPFTIKGVSDDSGLALRAQGSLLISNEAARTLYEYINKDTRAYGQYILASAIVESEDQAESVKQRLVDMGYEAQTAKDILGVVNTFINVLQGILLGFGALAVLTSVFGIINTQYISVLERTQQIGLMKALGMRRRDIGRLFKIEAAWIGFLGGIIGSGLAVAVGTVANPAISRALDIGDIHLLLFNPLNVGIVVLGLMLVSIGAGILPSRKAAKLDPVEALRTE